MTREEFIAKTEGCQRAFRRFLAALCCGDTSLADDIAQESLVKAYLSCNGLKDPDKFNSWLYRIGYNTFLNNRRSQRVTEPIENSYSAAAQERSDEAFRYQSLYIALANINESERSAILLYYMEGYSVQEIAKIQDVTADVIRQHLSRGRSHLRQFLTSIN